MSTFRIFANDRVLQKEGMVSDTLQIFAKDTILQKQGQFSDQLSNSVINVFFFLFLLIAIIIALAIIYKKFVLKQSAFKRISRSSIYQVMTYQSLGPKEKILILKIMDTVQIVLLNDHSIQILKEISYQDYKESTEENSKHENRFLDSLKDAMAYVKK